MAEIKKIKKGLDIPLKGKVENLSPQHVDAEYVGMYTNDYPGKTWKVLVKEGQEVGAGCPLMVDKESGSIYIVSPAEGVVKEIRRGERRKLEAVVVKCNHKKTLSEINNIDLSTSNLIETLCKTGIWAMLRQRPYDIVPLPDIKPRDIFITAFDSSPLAPQLIKKEQLEYLEAGIKALTELTEGKVYLGVAFGSGIISRYAQVVEFQGPHPAGNVGVQIASIKPINKGETILTLDARTAVRIGKLISEKKLDVSAEIAVTGPEVKNPGMVETIIGCDLESILNKFHLSDNKHLRIISGNVLNGIKESTSNGFLHFPFRQITVIEEGDNADEFMGWASMDPKKFSVKRSFPSYLRGLSKLYDFDSRIKGGQRAMILSEEYDKVFPFDIYPEYLLKAIIANDIDRMEKLGIYEIAPEDFALPEFVDTSKIPLQSIVREGLEKLRKEV